MRVLTIKEELRDAQTQSRVAIHGPYMVGETQTEPAVIECPASLEAASSS